VLAFSGERKSELDEEEVTFYVRKRYYGAFKRSVTLPASIDGSYINADFANSPLKITVQGGANAAA